MNFQVPQFIEIEDKIFGPLTFKQFVYVAGSLGGAFVAYTYLPKFLAWPIMAGLVIFGLLLAFYKINNRPFINMTESALRYFWSHKLYVWKKKEKKIDQGDTIKIGSEQTPGIAIPKLSKSKLKELSWSLDIREKIQ